MEHDAAHGPCPPPRDSRDTSPGPQGGAPPRVWALIGPRRGDAAQVRALVADLGLPAREIRVETNALREVPNALLGATRALLRDPQAGLVPPWPELVVGIGRRTVPLARWIRARSGGRTRLIHLGRPRAPLGAFDTVLSTAQYALPPAPGVVMLALPWQAPLSEPPASGPARHVVAVLGGDSWSVRLTGATVDALVARARAAARARGLPLVATTAPRTPPALAARLAAALGPDERLYDWAAAEGRDNPYRADLAGAGEIEGAVGALMLVGVNVSCINLAAVATFLVQRVRPRSWWEEDRARKAVRIAVASWLILLLGLAALIVFGDVGLDVG